MSSSRQNFAPKKFFNPTEQSEAFLAPVHIPASAPSTLCSYSSALRDIIDRRGEWCLPRDTKSLKILWDESDSPNSRWMGVSRRHLMERQLWRLQDLRDGGGFGFWVELFFPVVNKY
jgi:hypothetical protein